MAVTYVDSTTTGTTALTSSRAVPVPTGTAIADVVVVRLSRWESINPAVTLPGGGTGWVTRTQVVNGSGKVDTYLKRLTAADTGTYTFSWTGSMWTTGQATLYRGVDPAANLSTVSLTSATNSGTAWPAATLNGVADGVLDWHGYSDSGGTHTAPTNWTEVEDNDSDISAYRIITAGNFTTSGGASSVSSPNIASLLALPATAGGGTTPVTATRATTWRVAAQTTGTRSTAWRVRASVSGTRATTWDVLAARASTRATTWRVRSAVTATRATTWAVASTLASVTATRATTWKVAARVTATRVAVWDTRTVVTSSRVATWDVLTRTTATRATTWDTLSRSTATRSTTWRVLARPTASRSTTWAVEVTVVPYTPPEVVTATVRVYMSTASPRDHTPTTIAREYESTATVRSPE